MVNENLLANIQSGQISIQTISPNDFKALMTNSETKSYGLMICSRAYFLKAAEVIGDNMNNFSLNDEHNLQILENTKHLIQMDQNENFHINKVACAEEFTKYFLDSLDNMVDHKTKQLNVIQTLVNVFQIRKDIRQIRLNLEIIEEIDRIKSKYLKQDSSNNFIKALLNGWHEFQKELTKEETMDDLDYCDSTEDFFEMAVGNIGCVNGLFAKLGDDMKHLKDLIQKTEK